MSTAVNKSVVVIKLPLFNSSEVVLLSDAFLTNKNITSNRVTATQAWSSVGLLSFTPLLNLSSYVSVDELKDVKFSTLENTIKIGNNNINIPAMEIKSSALSVFISGTHSFNNDIDYQIKLLLSELISKKARKRNTNLDKQLLVEDDGLGRTTLYLKMDGTVDDPNIYFDKIRIKEKIKTEIKKEKEEIKKIVKEDVLNQKTDSTKKQEQPEVILEWEDE